MKPHDLIFIVLDQCLIHLHYGLRGNFYLKKNDTNLLISVVFFSKKL